MKYFFIALWFVTGAFSEESGDSTKTLTLKLPKICQEVGVKGPCKALRKGYFFNADSGRCVEFIWGGCKGNRVFSKIDSCVATCEGPLNNSPKSDEATNKVSRDPMGPPAKEKE